MQIKKVTEIKYKYDDKGNLVEKTEIITEYEDNYKPLSPTTPINPYPWQPNITYKNPDIYEYKIICQSDNINDVTNRIISSIKKELDRTGCMGW